MMWTNNGPPLYLSDDRTKVVEEGDPQAAFLLVATGGQLPMDEAERYGLIREEKAKEAQPNKAKPAPTNKSK